MSMPFEYRECWVDRWNPFSKTRMPLHRERVANDSPVGRLLEHPNVPSVTITYTDGETVYWKEKPCESPSTTEAGPTPAAGSTDTGASTDPTG